MSALPRTSSSPARRAARRMLPALVAAVAAACSGMPGATGAADPFAGQLIDLTHSFDDSTIVWPTSEPFRLQTVADGITDGGYYYAANDFSASEHGGTHIDAPVHFAAGGLTVDRIPLSSLVGPAAVLDVSEQCSRDPDYQVSVADLERWEDEHGSLPDGAILLLRTGFSERWPDAASYLGTADRGEAAVAALHFPGLHPDAARWLVANRRIRAVGIDTASIDYGQSTAYESHRVLFERDIPAFENLAALERLPALGAYVMALPMKIGGGSGAPLRAVAIVPPRAQAP